MAEGSDIRAGKAFVELGIKDRLTKALKGIGKQIGEFGKGVEELGKKFSLLGGAATAPMLLAAHSWAESGAELYRLSKNTGMSAAGLSALSYAAEESGGSAEGMSNAVTKMNLALAQAERGSADMVNAFAQLGLSVQQLKGLSAEEQFSAMADAVARINDPAQQTAFAMKFFGRASAELMPLLQQGSAGLAQFRVEAEELGLIKSDQAVKAAFELDMAWKRLGGSLNTIKGAVAGALAPMLRGIAEWTTRIAKQTREWTQAHQPLVKTLFMGASALLGVGGGLAIGGKLLSVFGGALGNVTKVFSLFAPLLSAAGIAFTFLLSPVGLLTAAIVGLGIYFLHTTGVISKAIDYVSGIFGDLLKDAKEDFGAIADALEAGDISAAFRVVTAQMKVWWEEAVLWLRTKWEDFKTWFFTTSPGLAKGLINAFAAVGSFFSDMVAGIISVWNAAVTKITSTLIKWAIAHPDTEGASAILGIDPREEAQQRLYQDKNQTWHAYTAAFQNHDPEVAKKKQEAEAAARRVRAYEEAGDNSGKMSDRQEALLQPYIEKIGREALGIVDQDSAAFQKQTEAAQAARQAAIDKATNAWTNDVDSGNAGGAGRIAAGQKAVDDARKGLADARAAAHKAGADARAKREMEKQDKPELGGIDALLGGRSTVAGTFSAAAARGMGGASHWEKLAHKMDKFIFTGEESTATLKKIHDRLAVGN